jgi:hypothetical protein
MERSDLDEVNDLLDEWFRGEGTGKELPNRLKRLWCFWRKRKRLT